VAIAERYIFPIYLSILFVVIAYLNHLVPLMPGDDYIFQLKIPNKGIIGSEKISSLADLMDSQVNFYNNYHYRVILHTVLQVLLLLPQYIFDLLNTIVFLILPLLVMRVIPHGRSSNPKLVYLLVFSFIWIFHFALGRAYFSTTGSLNYCWYLIPQLLFVIELYNRKGNKRNYLFLFLSLLTANGNENVLLTLCTCVAVIFIYKIIILKEKPDYVLALSGTILLIGGVIMLLSPSLQWRIAEQGMDYAGLSNRILEFGKRSCYYLIRCSPLLLILLFGYKRNPLSKLQYYLLFILIGSSLSMFLAPLYEPRTAIFSFVIFLMLVISLVDWSAGIRNRLLYITLGLSLIISVIRINIFQNVYRYFPDNIALLEKHKGSQSVSLQPQCYSATSGLVICEEISDNANFIDNKTLAAYYDIDSVILDKKYSTAIRKQKFISKIEQDKNLLSAYDEHKIIDNQIESIYLKETDIGLEVICSLRKNVSVPTKSTVILRGRKSGVSSHRIIQLFSHKLQLPFLDYLEYQGNHNNEHGSIIELANGQRLFYNHILRPDHYECFLISLYDINNHTSVGEVLEFRY